MKGRHDTQLVYVHEGGELNVGLVSCVPRVGDIVMLEIDGDVDARTVDAVAWSVRCGASDAYSGTPYTRVRVKLSRCE